MKYEDKKKIVSYSQFSSWWKCPHSWYLNKVKKLEVKENTIHTCFGTALHEALQEYIEVLYTQGSPQADSLNTKEKLESVFKRELEKLKVKHTEDEFKEFLYDGYDMLDEFFKPKNRMKYFPTGKFEFLGSELKITENIRNNLEFWALIDIALKDKMTGKIKIIDIKTSTYGWNRYVREDVTKLYQLVIYKLFYAKKYNTNPSNIDVEFFIIKRKMIENMAYDRRIMLLKPKSNKSEMKKCSELLIEFANSCFTEDGKYNENEKDYPKIPGKNKKHCKYCIHKYVNCDAKSDIKNNEY